MKIRLLASSFAVALLSGAALLAGPSFAVESDVDNPAWPELIAPSADLPDFLLDDHTIAEISPEGKPVIVEPEIVTGPPGVVD